MNTRPSPEPEPEATEEQLLQRCLDRPEEQQLEELERLCRAHPAAAAGLRRRYAMLASHGLVSLPLAPGHRWGAYRLVEEIGRGGMGVVYLAEHVEWQRRVALKFLTPELAASERAAERFRREIAALTRLDHPGVCTVYEAGEHHGQPYVAMRYVPGRTLAAVIDEARTAGSKLPVATVLGWFEAIARAVECAHRAGIVHRDLKPANVVLQDDDQPVVLDFGLARDGSSGDVTLTASQDAIGTPSFMAPEQVQGGAVGPWTDVHALGAMLYEALTSAVAFPGTSRTEVFHRVLHEEPTRLRVLRSDVGRDLEMVMASCLDKDPGRRYRDAGALAEDLRRVRERRPIAARPLPVWLRGWRWMQRNRVATAVLAAALLLAGAATWFAIAIARSDRAMRGRNLVLAALESEADSDLAAMYAEAAYRLDPNVGSLDFLRSALFEVHEDVRLRRPGTTYYDFALVGDHSVVVAGADPWCDLWPQHGAGPLRRLPLPGVPQAIAVGPAGTIAVAMQSRVQLFDAQGQALAWGRDGMRRILSLCWLGSRRLLVTRAGGATVLDLDDVADFEIDLPGADLELPVVGAASRDGTQVVLGSVDRAFVVALEDGRPGRLEELPGFAGEGAVFVVAIDPAGEGVLTASSSYLRGTYFEQKVRRNVARWWRRQGASWDLVEVIQGYSGEVLRAAVSPRGDRFAFSTASGQVWVHDAADGHLLNVGDIQQGNMGTGLAWSHDGSRLAVGTTNRVVYVFDANGMAVDRVRCFGLWGVEFAPDDRCLWTLGMDSIQRNRLDQPERLRGMGASLYFAAPIGDGQVLTCGKRPRASRFRDGRMVELVDGDSGDAGWLLHVAALPDGGFVTGGNESRVGRFDPEGRQVGGLSPKIGGWISRVLPRPDKTFVVVHGGAPGAALLSEDLQSKQVIAGVPGYAAGDLTPDGHWLAVVGGGDGRVQVWDLSESTPWLHWQDRVESAFHVRGIAISDDGATVVVGDGDGEVSVFDVGRGLRRPPWRAHNGPINDVDLAADGRIATASSDRTAAVWSPMGERLAHLRGHGICVWSARFLPSGRHVVTASDDGTARIWPLDAEDVLALARRDLHPEARRVELAAKVGLVGDLLDGR